MQKIIIPTSKCIPGMKTAQPIVDLFTGVTIIGKDQLLTEELIERIQKFIHTDIWVYLDSTDSVWHLPKEVIENYKQYSTKLEEVFGNISQNQPPTVSELEVFCSGICEDFTQNHTLLGCTNLMKELDYTTYRHCMNVAFLSMLICRWTKQPKEIIKSVLKAALLHDIGLINLPIGIEDNEERLTEEERIEYEKHAIYSYNISEKVQGLDQLVKQAILMHHEYCDGTGFPLRLTGDKIPLIAKIITIADTYERLHIKYHVFETLKQLSQERITQFDTDMVLTFCNNVANYYIGSFVTLNTGEIGEVVFINAKAFHRPMIKINNKFINLLTQTKYYIVSVE